MQHTPWSIHVEHLRKVDGSVIAIEDLSFDVAAGEIFGMVSPTALAKPPLLSVSRACVPPMVGVVVSARFFRWK